MIDRLNLVPPGIGEVYYMRLLLNVQRGCMSYECLRTINNNIYGSFQEACIAMGLLSDDKEFINGIHEVSSLASGAYLSRLFIILLLSNSMSNPHHVWDKTWEVLVDGLLYERRKHLQYPGILLF